MKLNWKGAEVLRQVEQNVADAMGDVGLEVEKNAKGFLWPGHGLDSGSMQRAIHTAKPSHNWEAEHRYPNAPERGGRHVPAVKGRDGMMHLEVGCPQLYSLIVHIKHYSFMFVGLKRALGSVPAILRKHRLR